MWAKNPVIIFSSFLNILPTRYRAPEKHIWVSNTHKTVTKADAAAAAAAAAAAVNIQYQSLMIAPFAAYARQNRSHYKYLVSVAGEPTWSADNHGLPIVLAPSNSDIGLLHRESKNKPPYTLLHIFAKILDRFSENFHRHSKKFCNRLITRYPITL